MQNNLITFFKKKKNECIIVYKNYNVALKLKKNMVFKNIKSQQKISNTNKIDEEKKKKASNNFFFN